MIVSHTINGHYVISRRRVCNNKECRAVVWTQEVITEMYNKEGGSINEKEVEQNREKEA